METKVCYNPAILTDKEVRNEPQGCWRPVNSMSTFKGAHIGGIISAAAEPACFKKPLEAGIWATAVH